VRWRWNATIALVVQRMRNGQKLPPQWQRNQAEDLVAVVFPDQLACLENIRGEREIPDHPLVQQTLDDCLTEAMDIDGLERLLERIEADELDIRCVDLNGPSPLSAEIINARPYAFLDDGEAENRRTRAISQSPNDLGDAATLSIITVDASEQVKSEAWIRPRGPDELHDGLMQLGYLTGEELRTGISSTGTAGLAGQWDHWFRQLTDEFRACRAETDGRCWWVATERAAEFKAVHPGATLQPDPSEVYALQEVDAGLALVELLRSRLSGLGPVRVSTLAADLALSRERIEQALLALQAEGFAMVMNRRQEPVDREDKTWCERRLLARIHRYSRERRRRAARPVSPAAFMRFLQHWHGLDEPAGELEQVLAQLEGWSAPAAAWEQGLLASRCADYSPQRLDEQFLSGFVTWFRPAGPASSGQQLVAATPVAIVPRTAAQAWQGGPPDDPEQPMGSTARRIWQVMEEGGALFTADLEQRTGLIRAQLEQGLAELIAKGLVTSDAFSPLRWLIRPEAEKRRRQRGVMRRRGSPATSLLGRWSATQASPGTVSREHLFSDQALLATVCESLLRRYGVVFRAVLERESLAPPWRLLLRYLRRMEDRGEVHGGRFVDGFSGEQFALPEAVGLLRRQADEPEQGILAVIHSADPLNLGGIITPGVRTTVRPGNRILLKNGVPVARIQGEELEIMTPGAIGPAEAERHLRVIRGLRSRKS
jgi:ATP-dependent Lhr-like helicase